MEGVYAFFQILANRTLIKTIGTFGLRVAMVQPTPMGFETYLSATRSDYQLLVRLIGAQIVNDGMRGASQIAKRLNEPLRVIEHVINTFSAQGWLSRVQTMADTHIISTSPDLKRFLRG